MLGRSFRYASRRLWNHLHDSFRQPRQSCLDSPPHSLVNSPLSSSHHHHSHHPSLLYCFTSGSKPTFSTNPSHLNTSGLPSRSRDRTGLIMLLGLFLVRFCLFVPCGGLSWLHHTSAFYCTYVVKYTKYRIVSHHTQKRRRLTLRESSQS